MDLFTAVESRRSIREFEKTPVDIDDIREIIRLAGLAPSVNNYQPWKYYVISNPEVLDRIALEVTREIALMPESATRMAKHVKNQAAWFATFFKGAPMLIALAEHPFQGDLEHGVTLKHDTLEQIRNHPNLQSAGASIQILLLAATAKGYGTCWMTGPLYARERIEQILDIKEPWRLISFVAIGKPLKKQSIAREKRNLADEMIIID
jgi:nitroreductase